MRYLICVLALCGAAPADTPTAIALRDARVVTVSGPTLERGTVLVRDGVVEAAGENVTIPADAWVIDARGLTVYPGLIDALSVLESPEAAVASAGGARTVTQRPATPAAPAPTNRGPEDRPLNHSWTRAADLLNAADRRFEDARNAGFTTVVVYPGAGIFAGQGAVVNLAGEKRRMVVSSPAGQYLTLGTSRSFGVFPGSLMGVMAYIRQVYLDAAHYQLQRAAWDRNQPGVARPDYDRALEGVLESPRVLLPAGSAVELKRMAAFARELQTKAILYGAEAGYQVPEALAQTGLPVLVSLKWPEKPRDADPDAPVSLRTLELRERAPSTPAAFASARVPFAFYTGGTAPRDVAKAVKRALDAGLSEAAAVRALTLGAAAIYGLEARLGSIDKGKIANLVVTDGPLFGEKTRIRYVFVDGVKFEPPPPEAPSAGPGAVTGGAR